jgi:hypothetical protein
MVGVRKWLNASRRAAPQLQVPLVAGPRNHHRVVEERSPCVPVTDAIAGSIPVNAASVCRWGASGST